MYWEWNIWKWGSLKKEEENGEGFVEFEYYYVVVYCWMI